MIYLLSKDNRDTATDRQTKHDALEGEAAANRSGWSAREKARGRGMQSARSNSPVARTRQVIN